MKSLYDGLTEIGVRGDRIHYESFGPATVLKPETKHPATVEPGHVDLPPVWVRFAKSGATAEWSRDKGTLLELAESIGLAPKFGCRSGISGTCITRISNGAVDYLEEPVAARGHGEVLLCCSIPRHEQAQAASGGERGGCARSLRNRQNKKTRRLHRFLLRITVGSRHMARKKRWCCKFFFRTCYRELSAYYSPEKNLCNLRIKLLISV